MHTDKYKSENYALIAITRHGCQLALDISQKIPPGLTPMDLFFPEKFKHEFAEIINDANFVNGSKGQIIVRFYSEKVQDQLKLIFKSYTGLIAIVSLGALIRLIAPFLRDKKTDPAVVVIDEKAQYVISVLSGHIGGANELTRILAESIGARPVITTASDVQKTIAVDLLGKEFGWVMEPSDCLTEISAAVVNGEAVAIVQESGEQNWHPYDAPLASNITVYNNMADTLKSDADYFIIITHRLFQRTPEFEVLSGKKYILLRPKVIGIGLGCNRNTSEREIHDVVLETLGELNFSLKSVRGIATIDLKSNEPGLISFCQKMNWSPVFYTAAELNTVSIENSSETVFKHTGAWGVSEPAAKIFTKNDNLALVKKVSQNVTISVGLFTG